MRRDVAFADDVMVLLEALDLVRQREDGVAIRFVAFSE